MVKYEMLRLLLAESGYKMQHVAGELSLTTNTFRKKLYGKSEFKLSEAMRLAQLLQLTDAERSECFFNDDTSAHLERRLARDKRTTQRDKARALALRYTQGKRRG